MCDIVQLHPIWCWRLLHRTVKPLHHIDADGTPKSLYAAVGNVAEVKLSGNLAVSHDHRKRASYPGCADSDLLVLVATITKAQGYANEAYSYVRDIWETTPRFYTWFGDFTYDCKRIIQDRFWWISQHRFTDFIYNCHCPHSGSPTWAAYICAYIFQSWCKLVTDKSLDQIPMNTGSSTSALPSGYCLTPVPAPRPERLSMSLPISTSTVPQLTSVTARLEPNHSVGLRQMTPSKMPTITNSSPRTTPIWIRCDHCWVLRKAASVRTN